jgi:hypothetical protein
VGGAWWFADGLVFPRRIDGELGKQSAVGGVDDAYLRDVDEEQDGVPVWGPGYC